VDPGWWKNPRHAFPVLVIASLVSLVVVWGLQGILRQDPRFLFDPGKPLPHPYMVEELAKRP